MKKLDFNDYQSLLRETETGKSIAVSTIASQFYCETKVELGARLGAERNQAMMAGIVGHRADLPFLTQEKPEKLWDRAIKPTARKPVEIREFRLVGRFGDFLVQGRADLASLFRGRALQILEYKFRGHKNIYDTDVVQCKLYGLLLRAMGFDTSSLRLTVVAFDSRDKEDAIIMYNSPELRPLVDPVERDILFEEKKATEDLEWALEYWNGARNAIPTKNPQKCRACEFRAACPDSRA
ncbi:MAG TPA: PD-(D/E)XK nuclease family protein [Spirochaetia bacterium]|nr:PD-(D/E)XK nuclease family protein [Spirochaetia bacterium]